jgi:hypothetical protein
MIELRKNGTLRIPRSAPRLRRAIACLCIALGIAGCVLPIVPGLPFFVIGGRLLGPRDRMLRHAIVGGRRGLRCLRRARQPLLRRAGHQLTPHWHSFTRLMVGAK